MNKRYERSGANNVERSGSSFLWIVILGGSEPFTVLPRAIVGVQDAQYTFWKQRGIVSRNDLTKFHFFNVRIAERHETFSESRRRSLSRKRKTSLERIGLATFSFSCEYE